MLSKQFKNRLFAYFPVTRIQYETRVSQILDALNKQQEQIEALDFSIYEPSVSQMLDMLEKQQAQIEALDFSIYEPSISQILDALKKQQAQIAALGSALAELQTSASKINAGNEKILAGNEKVLASSEKILACSRESLRAADEGVWAQIFNNTVTDSTWLKDKTFSPGRWAVGYPDLYAIYRILNETHPKHILDIGLGQTTRMFAQYAAAFPEVEHIVVEHDPDWISFFCNSVQLPKNTNIIQLEREMVPYKEAESVRVFKGFQEALQDKKFDFIMVDAPLGGDMKEYARIDILSLLPQGLGENFAILIDDAERPGETHTIEEIKRLLQQSGIAYKQGRYRGKRDSVIFCSMSQAFLSSL